MSLYPDNEVFEYEGYYWCKGHCDPKEFLKKITWDLGMETPETLLPKVHHRYMRYIPVSTMDFEGGHYEEWGGKPSRGAFKITCLDAPGLEQEE